MVESPFQGYLPVVPLWAGLRSDVASLILYTAVNFTSPDEDEGGGRIAKNAASVAHLQLHSVKPARFRKRAGQSQWGGEHIPEAGANRRLLRNNTLLTDVGELGEF